jgi:hypothetical protein|tara:strand:- start:623 stop:1012 length:390 start_codon:yes stop_codon:yes gene_type:complete
MAKPDISERVYLDLDEIKEAENPKAFELSEKIKTRQELKGIEESSIKARKNADAEILAFMKSMSADGIIEGDTVAEEKGGKSAGKWNKDLLVSILTPTQLEACYTPGKGYVYLMVDSKGKRAEKVRETL